jgi:hypothetical protein
MPFALADLNTSGARRVWTSPAGSKILCRYEGSEPEYPIMPQTVRGTADERMPGRLVRTHSSGAPTRPWPEVIRWTKCAQAPFTAGRHSSRRWLHRLRRSSRSSTLYRRCCRRARLCPATRRCGTGKRRRSPVGRIHDISTPQLSLLVATRECTASRVLGATRSCRRWYEHAHASGAQQVSGRLAGRPRSRGRRRSVGS